MLWQIQKLQNIGVLDHIRRFGQHLSHLGQMQMYVNYFDRHVKTTDEAPTVGILLCYDKNDALVELTLPQNSNIYAAQYQLYLPSKEELRQKIQEAEKAWEAAQ